MLLSIAYFPPISWFAAAAEDFTLSPDRVIPSTIYIDASENYQKQSYRNRCRYLSSQGVDNLNVPVVHENGTFSLPIKQIKVDYKTPWLERTERAIESAYSSSAYYEYYKDDLFAVLDACPETLWDLDMSIIRFFLEKTGIAVNLIETDHYVTRGSDELGEDLREIIHPKRPDSILQELRLEKPYFQVFSGKYGFQSNLSIMDLLFNEGPDSIIYLKRL